jgi:hypothetical protein
MNKILVSVSQTAVSEAENAIDGCQYCSVDASVSFARLLHSLRNYRSDEVEYILPVLAHCPTCLGEINEDTLVKATRILSRGPLF